IGGTERTSAKVISRHQYVATAVSGNRAGPVLIITRPTMAIGPEGDAGAGVRHGRIIGGTELTSAPGISRHEYVAAVIHSNGVGPVIMITRPVITVSPQWLACARIGHRCIIRSAAAPGRMSSHEHVAVATKSDGDGITAISRPVVSIGPERHARARIRYRCIIPSAAAPGGI